MADLLMMRKSAARWPPVDILIPALASPSHRMSSTAGFWPALTSEP